MKGRRVWTYLGACALAVACGGKTNQLGVGGAGTGGSGGASGGGASGGGASSSAASGGGHVGSPTSPGGVVVRTAVVDKIDILFDIDNSASMGDKQQYLGAAIPDLINRLINPNCLDSTMAATGPSTNGACSNIGDRLEFPPVHDMHIGIVSSALGPRLGDACSPTAMALPPFANVSAHNDDQAHLLNRSLTYSNDSSSATEGTVSDASSGVDQFLYWYPMSMLNSGAPGPGTPVTVPATLQNDFTNLVGGVGVFGCGIESQLETWYRFLIQPDPYSTLTSNGGKAAWSGIDTTILQERHDFLRPDSLVAIVVLSDENDSEIDVRSLSQQGFNWMSTTFSPPRGTAVCNTNPADPMCMSCADLSPSAQKADSNCAMGPYTSPNDWGMDLNLRHVHTKAKYGLDPQFPIQRYVNGLSNLTVPDCSGEYPSGSSDYQGMNDCTNPLFASQLPTGSGTPSQKELCQLPPGAQRTKDLVFYAHIGGVPSQLLHFTPGDSKASTLSDADWVKILGKDPLKYDYTGIDPHMIESYQPRANVAPPGSANNADAINGHDWVTNTGMGHILNVDREYACVFPLVDASGNPTTRDCTQPQNQNFCDCPHVEGAVTADELPPICDPTTQTMQTGAKAYPTIRELELAHLMGTQGIVSSICPQHVADNATRDDPLYGYRPAVAAIIDRLKNGLVNQCLPEQLAVTNGAVPCEILVQLPASAGGSCKNPVCDATLGLVGPGGVIAGAGSTKTTLDPTVLDNFCDAQEAAYQQQVQAAGGGATGLTDPAMQSVCALVQLTASTNSVDFSASGSCIGSKDPGWCYVTGAAAGRCPQAILFTATEPPHGAVVSLQCH